MDVNAFVQRGWAEHGDAAAAVMERFPEGIGLVRGAEDAPPLAALIVHVAGEHLGRWEDGLALLDSLSSASGVAWHQDAGKKLLRSRAVLRLCAGDLEGYDKDVRAGITGGSVPEESDRIRVLAIAASALAGQARVAEASAWFREALDLAAYGPSGDDPAARALAITGNNLACSFEDLPERSDEAVELMKVAARTDRSMVDTNSPVAACQERSSRRSPSGPVRDNRNSPLGSNQNACSPVPSATRATTVAPATSHMSAKARGMTPPSVSG
jgi:hypothetical protein